MSKNKGKPTGTYADKKTEPGKKGNYQRSSWPEDADTQYVGSAENQQQGKRDRPDEEIHSQGDGRERNRKPH